MPAVPSHFSKTFKLAFSVVFLVFFLWHLVKTDTRESWSYVHLSLKPSRVAMGLAVLSLVLPNWWLEAQRWRLLCRPFQNLDAYTALRAVLAGLATGFFTPGRLGECAGRLLGVAVHLRVAAALAWAAGGFVQWGVAFGGGLCAFLMYLGHAEALSWLPAELRSSGNPGLSWLVFAASLAVLGGAPAMHWFKKWVWPRIPTSWRTPAQAWLRMGWPVLWRAALLSAMRYAMFVFQYLLLLKCMGWDGAFMEGLVMVALTYFLTLFLPLIPAAEPAARGSLALLLFPEYGAYAGALLVAPMVLWTLNVAVPSVAGWLLLLRTSPRKV